MVLVQASDTDHCNHSCSLKVMVWFDSNMESEGRADRFCGSQGGAEIGIFGMLSSSILTMQLIINIINSSNNNNNNNNDRNNNNNNNNLNDNSMVMIMAGPGQNMNSRRLGQVCLSLWALNAYSRQFSLGGFIFLSK